MAYLSLLLGTVILYSGIHYIQGQLLNQLQNAQLRQMYRNQAVARTNAYRNLNNYMQQQQNAQRYATQYRLPSNPAKYYQQKIQVRKPVSNKVRLIPAKESVPSCIEAVSAAVKTTPYIDSLFYVSNGTVATLTKSEDSVCAFEKPCSWNVFPAGVGRQVKNKLHPSIISYCFEVAEVPSGEFLLFNSDAQDAKETTARFVSSTIKCSKSKISVNFKHWATKKVALQVCLRETDNLMWHCVNVPGASGLSTAVLAQPTGSFNVVILARNFGLGSKAAMLLDDVSVEFTTCDSDYQLNEDDDIALDETSPLDASLQGPLDQDLQPLEESEMSQENIEALSQRLGLNSPIDTSQDHYLEENLGEFDLGLASSDECQAVECDFEQGMCSYESSASTGAEPFSAQSGRYRNRVTGVIETVDGDHYAATYLREGQEARMSVNVLLPENRVIRFLRYDTTQSMKLSACCSTTDVCPYSTPEEVDPSEGRQWIKASFACPIGTDKIIFLCSNPEGSQHQGACGVDKITLLAADEGFSPEEAVVPICGGGSAPVWS